MAADEVVLYEVADALARITLNRPDALNAWTPELGSAYFDRLEEAGADPDVRAIVVTGAGRGFCAGADFEHLRAVDEGTASNDRDPRPQSLPRSIPKPVVAAINGPCAGLGFVMAMMCDIRFAAAGAKMTTAFARRGLVAEYGLGWILPRVVGPGHALDLLMSARTLLAEEAAEIGVVERLTEPGAALDRALEYAAELAEHSSPASMAAIKRLLYADLDRDFAAAELAAADEMRRSFERPDFREGVESFVERRPPRFEPVGGAPVPQSSAR
jgi:enoyl-CoA hydratase/carnithine racemase